MNIRGMKRKTFIIIHIPLHVTQHVHNVGKKHSSERSRRSVKQRKSAQRLAVSGMVRNSLRGLNYQGKVRLRCFTSTQEYERRYVEYKNGGHPSHVQPDVYVQQFEKAIE